MEHLYIALREHPHNWEGRVRQFFTSATPCRGVAPMEALLMECLETSTHSLQGMLGARIMSQVHLSLPTGIVRPIWTMILGAWAS